jgi:hypothetical protein
VHPYFDLHTGIQWNHLKSDKDVFDSISAASIELMGITWRPCGRCRGLTIPMRTNLLARSFDATAFGADPGTFKARPEVQFQMGIAFDLWGTVKWSDASDEGPLLRQSPA